MVISFIVKPSTQLHFRAIYIPWVPKYSSVRCSRGREYSAVPVRYIPKKSKECREPEPTLPRKHVVDLEKHGCLDGNVQKTESSVGQRSEYGRISFDSRLKNNKQRLITSRNDKVTRGKEDEVNADFVLEQGVAETDRARQEAERIAVQLLASRALTAVELKEKLLGRNFKVNVASAVITDFRTRGLINDNLYAEIFSRSRWSSLSWGPRRIKQALIKKGVSELDANTAIKQVFKDDGASGEQESDESGLGMSKLSLDHLFTQASKQWIKGRDVPREKRKARIVRWLQYRGFNWGVVSFILKKLESSQPQ